MKKKIIIITSNALRHQFFSEQICRKFDVKEVFIEGDFTKNNYFNSFSDDIVKRHFELRHNSELDFFFDNYDLLYTKSIIVEKGYVSTASFLKRLKKVQPELIVTYGCSIIRGPILDIFKDKIINIHLGISPYYKGSGTNFHALVNNDFKYFGYSIIFMNEKIDDGEIIHQRQADYFEHDTPHTLGNRLIKKMTFDTIKLIENFNRITRKKSPSNLIREKIYKRIDSNEKTVSKLYIDFNKNLKYYLKTDKKDRKIKLITQRFIR